MLAAVGSVYLHWFDKLLIARSGPFAQAKLVRYADDFVVLAPLPGPAARDRTDLEGWLGLRINRDKTRVVHPTTRIPGWISRLPVSYERDRHGRGHRYLHLEPSAKSLAKERAQLRQLTGPALSWMPIRVLIATVNRHLQGWREYFQLGYPRRAFRKINWFVRERLIRHLRRRSQRPFRPPEGTTWYAQLTRLGLLSL